LSIPNTPSARKKHFRSAANRQALKVFEAGRLYQADFFNSYIDFSDFALKLPGLTINCMRYVNDKTHRLRWVFKEGREGGTLLFCVVFTLLHGDELNDAVKEEAAKAGITDEISRTGSIQSGRSSSSDESQEFHDLPEEEKLGITNMDKVDANKVLGDHGLADLKIS
jgi:hypothetical protein